MAVNPAGLPGVSCVFRSEDDLSDAVFLLPLALAFLILYSDIKEGM
jgi:hypothetical protein